MTQQGHIRIKNFQTKLHLHLGHRAPMEEVRDL